MTTKRKKRLKIKQTKTDLRNVDIVALHNKYFGSDKFLNSYEWRKLRMEAIKKYGNKCECCGASPATGAVINVDHIKPRKLFPELALEINNLQILCGACNHGKGNWDTTIWRNIDQQQ